MTHTLKVRQIGSSLGVIIPKEVLTALNVREGDPLYITQGQEGFRIVVNDPDFSKKMAAFDEISRQYRNTFNELAK